MTVPSLVWFYKQIVDLCCTLNRYVWLSWFILCNTQFGLCLTLTSSLFILSSHRQNSKFFRLRKYRTAYRDGPYLRVWPTAGCCSSRPSLAPHATLAEASAWPPRGACDNMIMWHFRILNNRIVVTWTRHLKIIHGNDTAMLIKKQARPLRGQLQLLCIRFEIWECIVQKWQRFIAVYIHVWYVDYVSRT